MTTPDWSSGHFWVAMKKFPIVKRSSFQAPYFFSSLVPVRVRWKKELFELMPTFQVNHLENHQNSGAVLSTLYFLGNFVLSAIAWNIKV